MLQQHLATASEGCTYLSNNAQNKLLDSVRHYMQARIVEEIGEQYCRLGTICASCPLYKEQHGCGKASAVFKVQIY